MSIPREIKRKLSFSGLAEAKGGIIERMLAAALTRACDDLVSAPDLPTARKVALVIHAKPVLLEGELDDVILEFEVGGTVPKRVTSMRVRVERDRGGHGQRHFFFNVDAPDSPDQMSLGLSGDGHESDES